MKNHKFFLASFLTILLLPLRANAVQAENILGNQKTSQLINELDSFAKQSISVVRLRDGANLFTHDESLRLAPASVTKLLTSAAVLAGFSPAHTFSTRLYYTGHRKGSQVIGDLVVVGDGDPMIISEKLWQVAADLHHMGISRVSGNIVIDNGLFGDPGRDQARQKGSRFSSHAYDAEVSAFGVNFNTVAVAVAGGEQPGTANVALDPYPLAGVTLENGLTLRAPSAKIEVTRLSASNGERIRVTGQAPNVGKIEKIYRSVGDSESISGEYLRAFLGDRGINVDGKVVSGTRPANATFLYQLDSYPVRQLVAGLNTYSNNYIADMLLKRLGASQPQSGKRDARGSGTYENGVAAVTKFLRDEVGLSGVFSINDGSGLNPDNRISAAQITQVLQYMEKRMDLFPEYLASLPASGWDGTLTHRFSFLKGLHGLIRAKTGTLSEPIAVSALAGYFRHPDHGMVAFAILQNGTQGKTQPSADRLRSSQDNLLASWLDTGN